MKTRRIYRFGEFCLDATAKILLRDGEPIRAPRKAVETLLALLENAGQVVTKEELMAGLWPDRVVGEANLAQNIAVARRVTKVLPGAPGYIETFSGTGYRIVGPVTVTDEAVEGPHPQPANGLPAVPAPLKGLRRYRRPLTWAAAAAGLLLAAAGIWLSRRPSGETQEARRVPVARLAGKEQQPAISADGRRVAFVWERDESGQGGIWVQEEGASSPRRISPADGAGYSSPAWSPDGRRLAYLRFKQGQGSILVSPVEGGPARSIARVFPSRYGLHHRHLDWSPDGRFLAVDDTESPREALGIFLLSLDSGEKKRLTKPDDVYIGDLDPRFSPDGRTISFIRAFHRANQELFTLPAGGGRPVQLTSDARQVSGQDWLPGGGLVFGSNRTGEFRLWRIQREGKARPRATGIYGDFPLQISLARRAPALVYSELQHDLNIWRLDLRVPEKAPGRWQRLIASSGQDASPQYSPRGDLICFRSDRSGEEQIWVANSDGSNPVQVTRGSLRPSVGHWSPDGRSIVFNNSATTELFIAHLGSGGDWSVRPAGRQGVHPVYSPDGRWIYAGTMNSIVRAPAEGGAPTQLVQGMGISLGTSNDGRYVYFVREPAGSALWRVPARGGDVEKVLEGLVPFCSSCWALSPSGIYFLSGKQGSMDRQALYFRDFASGHERELGDYPETLSPIGSGPFSLSPDGRYLLCVRVDPSNSDVFRVEPFR
ncbi:MAG: PD40 domain-containing protein [Bryobacterales bacterium]|nr:PD40 domain-containing protein [Bryobacterales bacterium]